MPFYWCPAKNIAGMCGPEICGSVFGRTVLTILNAALTDCVVILQQWWLFVAITGADWKFVVHAYCSKQYSAEHVQYANCQLLFWCVRSPSIRPLNSNIEASTDHPLWAAADTVGRIFHMNTCQLLHFLWQDAECRQLTWSRLKLVPAVANGHSRPGVKRSGLDPEPWPEWFSDIHWESGYLQLLWVHAWIMVKNVQYVLDPPPVKNSCVCRWWATGWRSISVIALLDWVLV